MTPLEINKKIAELKGWKVFDSPNGWLVDQPEIHTLPNYAESISDAFELFEEMPTPQLRKNHDKSRFAYLCQLPIQHTEKDQIYGQAETPSLAICKAWIVWKEGQK